MSEVIAFPKSKFGISENKAIPIERIHSIKIDKFRSLSNREVRLGSVMTVLVGRNGTMKTSAMGLIAHPFDSESKDAFGRELKTRFKDVIKLSDRHDQDSYEYDLIVKMPNEDRLLTERVRVYLVKGKTNRHRIVVSGGNAGDGNFLYNTSFLNMKRLYPMVELDVKPDSNIILSDSEKILQQNFYESVFSKTGFKNFSAVNDSGMKSTFAPVGEGAAYGYESISSGEDNLGAIFNRMIGYVRAYNKDKIGGNGIFCIDEFEASLHPVAQIKLFKFLYDWAQKYRVQVVITTHSLGLIQEIYLTQSQNLASERILINFFSSAMAGDGNNYPIYVNPNYNIAYSELTLKDPDDVVLSKKVPVFLEDETAKMFLRKIIKKRNILSLLELSCKYDKEPNPGTSYTKFVSLCKNFPALLKESIVIFDPDVSNSETNAIKQKEVFLVMPDPDSVALERRMIAFIISLNSGHDFFLKMKKEKARFISEIKEAGVVQADVASVLDDKKTPIASCKRWADSVGAKFSTYVGYYCDNHLEKDAFLNALLSRINNINLARGLPLVSKFWG